VDGLFVMAYDMNRSSIPSPVAPLSGTSWNDTQAVSSYAAVAPPAKVLLGVPFYGYDWPTTDGSFGAAATGPPAVVTYGQVAAAGRPEHWDASSQVPWTAYQDGGGHWHEVYYEDPASLALKAELADREGLGGVGIWALGMDGNDPATMAALLGRSAPLKPGQVGQSPSVPGSLGSSATPSPSASATASPSPSPSQSPSPSPSPSPPPSPSPTPSPSPSPSPTPSPTPSPSASATPTPSASASVSPSPSSSASP